MIQYEPSLENLSKLVSSILVIFGFAWICVHKMRMIDKNTKVLSEESITDV